jgi:2-oxo-3-hexenedioate decarboxylase
LPPTDPKILARELLAALSKGETNVPPPSSRDSSFDLTAAYAVEAEAARLRRAAGHATVGLKVGYANKAVWRVFKLNTLVWAHMYNDTVQFAPEDRIASLSVGHMSSPKIEPEIVFKAKKPLAFAGDVDALSVLESVEWLALGFEIIACPFPKWKFQPVDFIAACGLHAALIVGPPLSVGPADIPTLVNQLPQFKVSLLKNNELAAEGSGRNSLRSPALCLGELAAAIARDPVAEPLAAGELVSSGTLTESEPIAAGETWKATVEGIDLPDLTLRCEP